jgi:hypothetical protein
MSETNVSRILISQNQGETWRAMPPGWRQSGTILEANDSIVRQDAGGGREVWYRVDSEEDAETAPGEPGVLSAFVASMSHEDRDALDAILEGAEITPEDPRYAGIAATMYTAAMLARRIDALEKSVHGS